MIFDEEFGLFTKSHRLTTKQAIAARITENCRIRPSNICDTILDFIPILKWLPKYNIRQNLIHDIVGGLTVGIMNVPQGKLSVAVPSKGSFHYLCGILIANLYSENCVRKVSRAVIILRLPHSTHKIYLPCECLD